MTGSSDRAHAACRGWGSATAAVGAVMVIAPGRLCTVLAVNPAPLAVVRILGAREVTQALVLLARPNRRVAATCTGVDVLHAASMVIAAAGFPRYHRAAMVSGLAAAASAVAGGVCLRLGRPG